MLINLLWERHIKKVYDPARNNHSEAKNKNDSVAFLSEVKELAFGLQTFVLLYRPFPHR
jgi:hypothetical protein